MKVLVVDDEPLIRRSLERVLSLRGHQVVTANDGASGLSAWRENQPKVVILDVLMPEMTGPQVIQQMTGHHQAKVVLMSAYQGPEQKPFDVPYDLYLSKPFDDIFSVVDLIEELDK